MRETRLTILLIVLGTISILFGITYSFFNYTRTGGTNELVVGNIYMHYTNDNNALSLTNVLPRNSLDFNVYIEFTISGLNEYEKSDIVYAIDLLHGDVPTGKTENNRIRDDLLRFALVKEIDNNEEEVLLDNVGYPDLDELRMFVETVPKETNEEISHTYRLYMWISDEINVGNTQFRDYTIEQWNNLFASIKVRVVGDFIEKEVDDHIRVVFDANGGKVSPAYRFYEEGDTYGTLPNPVREGYRFMGWRLDASNVLGTDTVISPSRYAFQHDEQVEFTNSNDNYINTGVSLFNSSNLHKNFYLSFNIVDKSQLGKYGVVVSSHYAKNSRGFIFQRNNNNNSFILQTNKNNGQVSNNSTNHKDSSFSWNNVSKIDILRLNDIIYYVVNDGTPVQAMDYSGFTAAFDVPVVFGANLTNGGIESRSSVTLSNMIIAFLDSRATVDNYLEYLNRIAKTNRSYTLTAIWERDVMNTFPEFITDKKTEIKQIIFKKENATDLLRYNAIEDSTLKGDIATEGSIKAWLEKDNNDNLYTLYVESDRETFLTTGEEFFMNFSNLVEIDFSNINTSEVTMMKDMFTGCTNLQTINIEKFNTKNVTTMQSMFSGCSQLQTLDLSSFNTSSVTSMMQMFADCSALKNLDLSGFNTSSVTSMSSMFNGCSQLQTLDLSNFNTSSVTIMNAMFRNCSSLTTIYVGNNWTVDGLTSANSSNMFSGCSTVLTGGNGTHWASVNPKDATYAIVDEGPESLHPGYLTDISLKPSV